MNFFENLMNLPTEFLVAMILIPILVGGGIVFYLVKTAGGKTTTDFRTYAPSGGEILSASDVYTHTTETRTHIPQNKKN